MWQVLQEAHLRVGAGVVRGKAQDEVDGGALQGAIRAGADCRWEVWCNVQQQNESQQGCGVLAEAV